MDLLQEISNRLRDESNKVWNRFVDKLHDATIGIVKDYQSKTMELIKISAATFYVQGLRIFRKHLVLLSLAFFGTMVTAVAAVVVPVAIVMVAPWTTLMKILCLVIIGCIYIGGTAWVFLTLFSEDKWLKISGVQDFLDSIYDPNNSNKL